MRGLGEHYGEEAYEIANAESVPEWYEWAEFKVARERAMGEREDEEPRAKRGKVCGIGRWGGQGIVVAYHRYSVYFEPAKTTLWAPAC